MTPASKYDELREINRLVAGGMPMEKAQRMVAANQKLAPNKEVEMNLLDPWAEIAQIDQAEDGGEIEAGEDEEE